MANNAALYLAQVAYDAGFRGQALENMVAVGLAESGGNPNAVNDNPKTGDYSVGYWQINYYGALAQGRTKTFGPPQALHGIDPLGPEAQANAKAAFALSGGGQNLNAWSTAKNGAYLTHLPEAKAAVASLLGGGVAPGSVGNVPGTFNSSEVPDATNIELASATSNPCLIKLPSVLGVGGNCLLSTSQARAILGVGLMVGGVTIALVGIVLVAGKEAGLSNVASAIPGPVGMVASVSKGMQERSDQRQADKAVQATPEQKQRAKAAFKGESKTLGPEGDPSWPS